MSPMVSQQSQAANAATSLQQGQDTVVSALQQRFNDQSGVNINTEMSNLIALQNAYGANARVMSTIQPMMSTLTAGGAVMSITGAGSITAANVMAQNNMFSQLEKLSQQLGTGQAAQTYAGLGSQAGVALSFSAQLSALSDYSSTAQRRHDVDARAVGADPDRHCRATRSSRRSASKSEFSLDKTGRPRRRKPPPATSIKLSRCSTPRPATTTCFRAAPSISSRCLHQRHSQRQRCAGRPHPGDLTAPAGRPGHQRARPSGHPVGRQRHRPCRSARTRGRRLASSSPA